LIVTHNQLALQDKLPPKGLLWELIFPQDASGQPAKTASGKYHVKCFVMDEWRRVTVDDRIPVDAYGAPLLVGSMPAQLWPLILSKAILKLMALYQVANGISMVYDCIFDFACCVPSGCKVFLQALILYRYICAMFACQHQSYPQDGNLI